MPCESIWDCWSATQSALFGSETPKALPNNKMNSQRFIASSKRHPLHCRTFRSRNFTLKQTPLFIGVDADHPCRKGSVAPVQRVPRVRAVPPWRRAAGAGARWGRTTFKLEGVLLQTFMIIMICFMVIFHANS